jgi:RNA polymerase sigma-70 factor (ECF subfamily)
LTASRRALRQRAPAEALDLVGEFDQEQAWDGVLEDPGRFLERVSSEVRGAVKALPAHERMVFLLRSVEGFSYRDIAETLEIPMGTVMSHLFRARNRLRERLTEHARATGFIRRPS